MEKFKSVFILVLLSFAILVMSWIIGFGLLFLSIYLFFGGTTVGFLSAVFLMEYISNLILLPISLWLTYFLFKKLSKRLNLQKLNRFVIITVSFLILSLPATSEFVGDKIYEYKLDVADESLNVEASIVEERIEKLPKYKWRYHYTISINNLTSNQFSLILEITPGKLEGKYIFEELPKKIYVELSPGENLVTGEYPLEVGLYDDTYARYPESGQVPISIRMMSQDRDLLIDKTINIYSSLSEWKEVFIPCKKVNPLDVYSKCVEE